MTSVTVVKDPVCGMDIDVDTTAERTEYKRQTYYFCRSCRCKKFDLNPEQYIERSVGPRNNGEGCCSKA